MLSRARVEAVRQERDARLRRLAEASCASWAPLDKLYLKRYAMAPKERMAGQIKMLRERRGMTQEQLAQKSGIGRSHLARLETGKQDPTLSTLEKIAAALGVKVGRLE